MICGNDEKVNWRFTAEFECGFIYPTNLIINKIRAFCFEQGVQCEVFKSGFLIKTIQLMFSGYTSIKKKNQIADAIMGYLHNLENV